MRAGSASMLAVMWSFAPGRGVPFIANAMVGEVIM
jgi:hypothetical protein